MHVESTRRKKVVLLLPPTATVTKNRSQTEPVLRFRSWPIDPLQAEAGFRFAAFHNDPRGAAYPA